MEFGINDWRNAIFESGLSPKARLVGLALAKYYRQGKECFPSYRTLWEDTGYTNNHTIADAINELKESGFIRIKKGKIKNLSIQSQAYEFVGVNSGESTGEVTGENNSPEIREEDNKINKRNNNIKNKRYGECQNVLLSEEQFNKLSSEHPDLSLAIEKLDTWLGTSGSKNRNKNHYAYFKSNSWVWEGLKETKSDDECWF